ncbi:MAG: hypothetical protein ACRDLP_09780 [Solirubrobacteraceae bacterium]
MAARSGRLLDRDVLGLSGDSWHDLAPVARGHGQKNWKSIPVWMPIVLAAGVQTDQIVDDVRDRPRCQLRRTAMPLIGHAAMTRAGVAWPFTAIARAMHP